MSSDAQKALAEASKAQWVRVADVFVIGPLMVWGGLVARRRSALGGLALAACGVATVAYNARNYYRTRQVTRRLRTGR